MIRVLVILLIVATPIVLAFTRAEEHKPPSVSSNYVPDKETAVRIAEAVWLPIYGESIYKKKPFIAKLIDSKIWVVTGSLPSNSLGGVPYIEIQKSDCKVLRVSHGQ